LSDNDQKVDIKAYIEVLRPGWWLACFFIGLTPGMLAIFTRYGDLDEFLQFKTIMWAFGYWASIVGIYVYNDIVGIEEDAVVNPKRPMPANRISKKAAGVYAGIIIAAGLILWWGAFQNIHSSLIQIACIVVIAIYSTIYKNNFLLGLGAGLIPVGVWIAFAPFSNITIAMFLIIFFWEMTLDVPENLLHYDGDVKVHPQTFAVALGKERFAAIGLVFAVPTVIASAWLLWLLEFSIIYMIFATVASFFLLFGIASIRNDLAPMKLGRALGLAMLFIFVINIGIILHTIVNTI
jgi:4-hydroxybenzoate polyprenyltransferase